MLRLGLVSVLALAGCFDFDLDFDQTGGDFAVHSDSGQMVIDACATSGLLGCAGTGNELMTVVIDGEARLIPPRPKGLFELFAAYDHQLATASPEDPYLGIVISGHVVEVEELPWFDYDAPAAAPSRAAGVDITYQAYPDATVEIAVTSQCGAVQDVDVLPAPTEPGKAHVPLRGAPELGACTHDVRVTQTLPVDVPDRLDGFVQVGRTEHASVTTSE